MVDPFSLTPFASFQFPQIHDFTRFFFTPGNILLGAGENNLLLFELDQEIKRQNGLSLFSQQKFSMYEEIRSTMVQPDVDTKRKGMFQKHITVKSALEKSARSRSGSREPPGNVFIMQKGEKS